MRAIIISLWFVIYFVCRHLIMLDYGRKCGYLQRKKNIKPKKDKWVFFSLGYFDIIFLESRFIWKRKLFNYW